MKIIKLFLWSWFLLVFSLHIQAQWQTQNNKDYYYTGRYLGVGTSNPDCKLTVINDSSYITYNDVTLISSFCREYENSAAMFGIYGYPNTNDVTDYMRSSIMLYSTHDAKNLKICAAPKGSSIQFITSGWNSDSAERMRIDSMGYIGIATTEPKTRLHVADGDIYISDIDRGIIMKSPDGQCWKGTMSNTGNLNFTPVECPEDNYVPVNDFKIENPIKARFFQILLPISSILNSIILKRKPCFLKFTQEMVKWLSGKN